MLQIHQVLLLTRERCIGCDVCATACPKGCQVCVDACPAKAISLDIDGNLSVDERFCIYCSTCQEACPEKIVSVNRTGSCILTSVRELGFTALEKLTSRVQMVKELSSRAREKTCETARIWGGSRIYVF